MMDFDLSRFMRTYGIQDYHNAKMVLMSEKTNYRGEDTDVNMVTNSQIRSDDISKLLRRSSRLKMHSSSEVSCLRSLSSLLSSNKSSKAWNLSLSLRIKIKSSSLFKNGKSQ